MEQDAVVVDHDRGPDAVPVQPGQAHGRTIGESGDAHDHHGVPHDPAHRFRAGHRIRLQVSGGAHPRYARNLGTGEPLGEATRDEVVRRDRDDSSVSQFLVAADGVLTLDTSEMTFEESVAAAIAAVDAVRSAG